MRSLVFEGNSRERYEEIRRKDKILHKNLRRIIQELMRSVPTAGAGKPEALKYALSGFWSRRISREDRVINKFDENYIYIFAIGGHNENMNH